MPPRDHFEGASFEQIEELFHELHNVSDRVTAITCAAFLDDMLGAALLDRFVKLGATWKDRIFNSPNAPLSSFYSKAVTGYALGLFGALTYGDLDIIRHVRNQFAHTATPVQFKDEGIAQLCSKLTTPNRINLGLGSPFPLDPGPKGRYARTVSGIAQALLTGDDISQPSFPTSLP